MSTRSVIERSGARTTPRSATPRPRSASAGRMSFQNNLSTTPRSTPQRSTPQRSTPQRSTPPSRGRPARPTSHPADNASAGLSDRDIRMYIATRNASRERPSPNSMGRMYSQSQTRERTLERTPRRDRSMSPGALRIRASPAPPAESPLTTSTGNRKQTNSFLRSSSVDALARTHSPFTKSVHIGMKSPGSPSSFMSKAHSARGTVKLEGAHHSVRNAQLLNKFREYRLQGKLIDLTLGFFGGLEIKCHRIILASASPYFKSLLSSGNRHVTRHDFIQMRGVQYSVMDILVDYAYSGTIVGVERDLMTSLTESSRVFKFREVHEACKVFNQKEKKYLKSRTIGQVKHIDDDSRMTSPKSDVGRADDDSGQESSSEIPLPERTNAKNRSRHDSGNGSREDANSQRSSLGSSETAPPDFSYSSPKHANDILREVNRTRREAILFDVVMRTQTKDFPCQRLILETTSPYLSQLITQELQGSKHMDVFITRIPADVLQKLIGYMYTGKLEITERDVKKIYRWARKFQLGEVCDACCSLDETLDNTKSIASEKTTLTNPE